KFGEFKALCERARQEIGAASDEAVLSRLQQQVEARLAAYQPPDQDPEVIAGLEAVVARARHELAAEL
ncbi:MAG: hypothetical protein HUU35_03020, partial [Armatimonadetes bacterium]|nr:hypothetical protein [Armatimonadota bacterium]